jgi:hypothetical protein
VDYVKRWARTAGDAGRHVSGAGTAEQGDKQGGWRVVTCRVVQSQTLCLLTEIESPSILVTGRGCPLLPFTGFCSRGLFYETE